MVWLFPFSAIRLVVDVIFYETRTASFSIDEKDKDGEEGRAFESTGMPMIASPPDGCRVYLDLETNVSVSQM